MGKEVREILRFLVEPLRVIAPAIWAARNYTRIQKFPQLST